MKARKVTTTVEVEVGSVGLGDARCTVVATVVRDGVPGSWGYVNKLEAVETAGDRELGARVDLMASSLTTPSMRRSERLRRRALCALGFAIQGEANRFAAEHLVELARKVG